VIELDYEEILVNNDHQPTVDTREETDAAAATRAASSGSASMVIEQVAVNTADSDGEDAGATGAETSLTIDPVHAEAGTTELNTAPMDTIVTSGSDITERHPAQNSAMTVIGDIEAPAVSVSNSASSSGHSNSRSAGGLIEISRTNRCTIFCH